MTIRMLGLSLVGLLWTGWASAQAAPAATATGSAERVQTPGALPEAAELPYKEGLAVPQGYELVERPRYGLVATGSVFVGVLWTLGIVAIAEDYFGDQFYPLLVPGVGPWLMLASGGGGKQCKAVEDMYVCEDRPDNLDSALVADGVGQTVGGIMLIAGLAYPTKHLVPKGVTASIAPMPVGEGGYGLRMVGRF